jgi:endonuclease/exonuclease/phosphatase family metal-dependent hydrolase
VRNFVAGAVWAFAALALALWLVMRFAGDRWWVATILIFGPRWVWALPMLVVAPAALLVRPRPLLPLLITLILLLFPVMGLCVPWLNLVHFGDAGPRLRLLTCNTHDRALNAPLMAELIDRTKPDIVVLQEWRLRNRSILFHDGQWNVLVDGELCIASRYPVGKVQDVGQHWSGWAGAAVHYEVQTPTGPVQLFNVHLESPHLPFRAAIEGEPNADEHVEQNSEHRLIQAKVLRLAAQSAHGRLLLAGDFNTPCDSNVYREDLDVFSDAFSEAGWGFGWTYRVRGTATRIDHILTGPGWECRRCWVGPSVGSPHRPLIADLEWKSRGIDE